MQAFDCLFELGCEELPSGSVKPLAEALASNVTAALAKAKLSYEEINFFATPRRLGVLIRKLQDEQPSQLISRRGPPLKAAYDAEGKPTPALLGFAKSSGVNFDELVTLKTEKGEWVVHETTVTAVNTREIVPTLIKEALENLPLGKPMRWGSGLEEFARPVHWAVLLYGEEALTCSILGVQAGRLSFGHRFHHPQAIAIDNPENYQQLLQNAFVIADFSARREQIIQQVNALAEKHNARAIMPAALLDEVTSIVEWPKALLANFSADFLHIPQEVLIASMNSHQKCFALEDRKGKLLPHFITVANIASNNSQQVIAGNEKVMHARLSDAAFFCQQDKKMPLNARIPGTEKVIFQVQLGSLLEKSQRMEGLIQSLVGILDLDPQLARRAAALSKCDLLTGMVGEFPELQGTMGYYYACHDGEDDKVAIALKEQYMPRFAADDIPSSALGIALSLVDRLDNLVGIFAIGQKPSGVKDPFKLRRHALAVIRLLLVIPTPVLLNELLKKAFRQYKARLPKSKTVLVELHAFILERLQSYYQNQAIGAELVLAVRAREENWLYDFDKRIRALNLFKQSPEMAVLAATCKRVSNLLHQAKQLDSHGLIDERVLEESAEKALYAELKSLELRIKPLYAAGKYEQVLECLTTLQKPIDAFFEQVMVMVANPALQKNRLYLLSHLQRVLQGVADISLLPGQESHVLSELRC